MSDQAHRVAVACNQCYVPTKPCNLFTQDVARTLGVTFPVGKADTIINVLNNQWREITANEAILQAGKGVFIVAGLRSTEFSPRKDGNKVKDGHICVVIPGQHGAYPRVVSTNADPNPSAYGKSRGEHPLNGYVFSHADATKVHYYAHQGGASGSW